MNEREFAAMTVFFSVEDVVRQYNAKLSNDSVDMHNDAMYHFIQKVHDICEDHLHKYYDDVK